MKAITYQLFFIFTAFVIPCAGNPSDKTHQFSQVNNTKVYLVSSNKLSNANNSIEQAIKPSTFNSNNQYPGLNQNPNILNNKKLYEKQLSSSEEKPKSTWEILTQTWEEIKHTLKKFHLLHYVKHILIHPLHHPVEQGIDKVFLYIEKLFVCISAAVLLRYLKAKDRLKSYKSQIVIFLKKIADCCREYFHQIR